RGRAGRRAILSGGRWKSKRSTRIVAGHYALHRPGESRDGGQFAGIVGTSTGGCAAGAGGGGGGANFCGLLSAAIEAWTMKVGCAGGSPRSIASTPSIPAITRPKLV